MNEMLAELYRSESRRILAALIRILGDFDLAEDAMQEAFALAAREWDTDGVPANPRAWLISAGRFRALDRARRESAFRRKFPQLALRAAEIEAHNVESAGHAIADDRLRLIFTCCHPAIDVKIQVPLTLREVCGLKTEEIAEAFLVSPATMAQRIVRGKAKIRDAGIPFAVPASRDLPERLDAVLSTIYLVFNEGYAASTGEQLVRIELCQEAIRLGRLLLELLPDPEVLGLLALMLLTESRRKARIDRHGDLVLLENQDRTLWDRQLMEEGRRLVRQSLESRRIGFYSLQAAIAAVHSEATTAAATDWNQIASLYEVLIRIDSSPVIELNRAVAVAMRDGPESGVQLIDEILSRGELTQYHLTHAARADLLRKSGKIAEAVQSYEAALRLAKQEPERRFLRNQLKQMAN